MENCCGIPIQSSQVIVREQFTVQNFGSQTIFSFSIFSGFEFTLCLSSEFIQIILLICLLLNLQMLIQIFITCKLPIKLYFPKIICYDTQSCYFNPRYILSTNRTNQKSIFTITMVNEAFYITIPVPTLVRFTPLQWTRLNNHAILLNETLTDFCHRKLNQAISFPVRYYIPSIICIIL